MWWNKYNHEGEEVGYEVEKSDMGEGEGERELGMV